MVTRAERHLLNKDEDNARSRQYYLNNKDKFVEYSRRCEAKRKEKLDTRRKALLDKQGGVCAICGTDNPGTVKGWQLDHDHACCSTKQTRDTCGKCDRGVLCRTCNQLVVAVLDKYADRIKTAMTYLGWNP